MVAGTYAISQKRTSFLQDFLAIILGSFLISLCAPISLKLPFTPIPLAIAPHLCLAFGLLLGPRRGLLTVLAYLFQGAIGLPVFAGGAAGWINLFGPSGGYLLGAAAGAYVTGTLMENLRSHAPYKAFVALVAGNLVLYLLGIAQLSLFIGFKLALLLGVLPFLLGDALKLLVIYKGFSPYLSHRAQT